MRCATTLAAVLLLAPGPVVHASEPLLDRLLIVAPAAPGGGWDQTARAMQHALEREGLVHSVEVQNVAGAAGTIGLAQFIDTHKGNDAALLVTGLVMLGAIIWNESPVSLAPATPIARLTAEYEVIAVPAASPHRDMRSLVEALRQSPGSVSWGGGSAGGTDHMLAGLVAAAAGVDPRRINYIAFSGGGEAVAALLGGNVTAGVSGYSEFAPHIDAARLRALALSAPSRAQGIHVPTLSEQGIGVELTNWRGVIAPPSISGEGHRRLAQIVERMVQSDTWRSTLDARGWTPAYLDDSTFARYLEAERVRTARIVSRLRIPGTGTSRAGQHVYPAMVFTCAGVATVLLALLRKKPRATADPSNRAAVARVAGGLLIFLLLLQPLGFVAAATVMFVVVAAAFPGSVEVGRLAGPAIALLFSAAVYLAFTRGLDLALPSGAIWSWIR